MPATAGYCIVLALLAVGWNASASRVVLPVTPGENLAAAVQRSRLARQSHPGSEIELALHGGVYFLEHPLILTTEDDGLIISAYRKEIPVISGGAILSNWRCSRANPNVWQTEIAAARNGNWNFHELFVNGERKPRTRVPEEGFFHVEKPATKEHPTRLQVPPGEIKAEWARRGDVELVVWQTWEQARNQIRGLDSSNFVSLAGDAVVPAIEPHERFYLENVPRPLRPDEWYLDARSGQLSYWPDAGEDVPHARITAPRLYDLIRLEGTSDHPVHGIVLRGLTFADADWRLDGGSDFDGQAAVEVPAAVQAKFAHDCVFEHCLFRRLGGYALDLGTGCERDKVIGNDMSDLGAGGIRVGATDMNEALLDPCGQNIITDNHIHQIGLVNAPGVGILVLLSGQNLIAHNEVDHTFYSAISVGWTWGYAKTPCRENIIEFNLLHDIGQGRLSDMGGVYTLGVQPGTIVRNNVIHDVTVATYGGWGLYTDEGSSDIVLENNVVYRCQSAGFHQHYGRENIVRNNIFAFNRDSQLMRTRNEKHLSFIFTNNIVYYNSGRLLGGNWAGDDLEMDHNIYFDTRSLTNHSSDKMLRWWQKRGHDLHSLWIDPRFRAPEAGDFRLKAHSPALAFGFHKIDLTSVGVRLALP